MRRNPPSGVASPGVTSSDARARLGREVRGGDVGVRERNRPDRDVTEPEPAGDPHRGALGRTVRERGEQPERARRVGVRQLGRRPGRVRKVERIEVGRQRHRIVTVEPGPPQIDRVVGPRASIGDQRRPRAHDGPVRRRRQRGHAIADEIVPIGGERLLATARERPPHPAPRRGYNARGSEAPPLRRKPWATR
jgi:hypothetical protein